MNAIHLRAVHRCKVPIRWWVAVWLGLVGLLAITARAEDGAFTNLLVQSNHSAQHADWPGAFKYLTEAKQLAGTNGVVLCQLTKAYCDLMHQTSSGELQKKLALQALATAQLAVQAAPTNPTAHLCVAVAYVKNFPYAANAQKVIWSRAIKTECETAIALDPRQDVGYYLLGRWEVGVANMNFLVKGLVKLVYGGLPAASNAEAIQNFKKAIALAPQRIIHHAELAKVYAATGERQLALAEWHICDRLRPVDADDADAQGQARQLLAAGGNH